MLGVKCHVGDNEDRNNLFKQTIDKFGGLDIFVSNAAVNPAVGMCVTELRESCFDLCIQHLSLPICVR